MEKKIELYRCHIAVNEETGRVQWCVGEDKTWPNRLKRLALFPVILLPLVIILIIIAKHTVSAEKISFGVIDNNEILDEEENIDIFRDLRTSYVPQNHTVGLPTILERVSRFPRDIISLSRQNNSKYLISEDQRQTFEDLSFENSTHITIIGVRKCNCTYKACNNVESTIETNFKENINLKNKLLGTLMNETIMCKCCEKSLDSNCHKVQNKTLYFNCNEEEEFLEPNVNETENQIFIKQIKIWKEDKPVYVLPIYKFVGDLVLNNLTKDCLDFLFRNNHFEVFANFSKEDLEKVLKKNKCIGQFKKHTPDIKVLTDNFWKKKLNYQEVRQLQAQVMMLYMNESANPCDDFFNYACGHWKEHHSIPADRITYDTFEMLRENLDFMLRDLLEDESENELTETSFDKHDLHEVANETWSVVDEGIRDTTDATIKAKYLYSSCMNEEILESRGAAPLKQLLDNLGGWPISETGWNKQNFDLIWLLAQLKLFNNDILISEWIGPDIKNSEMYIIQLDQTSLGLPSRDYFTDSVNWKYIEAYRDFIISTLKLMGTNATRAKEVTDEIIHFETKLAMIMDSPMDRKNLSAVYVRITIETLTAYFPSFDWLRYFSIVLDRNINLDDYVVCYCLSYLHKLFGLLRNTKPDIIANYILWRFVRHRTNNLDSNFSHIKQKFYYTLFGREEDPPRWQFCVSQVNSNMGMAAGSLFVRRYFDEISKNDTLQMTKELQQSFKQLLDQNKWIDEETKAYAKDKIDTMNLKIGYPDFLLNKDELNNRYLDVKIHPDLFFENVLNLLRHSAKREQERIGTCVNKTAWSAPPAVVNAYYSRNKNQIMFPAGILQPPFYHRFFPKSLNFGGIGVVIGHEITHGFDDKGRLFDFNGNLEKWWKQSSIDEFHKRARCLKDQYDSYFMPSVQVHIDGELTQGENIADNGGLKQAFSAYNLWLSKNPSADETLPGLNLTAQQLFFLNFAQVWCGIQRPESAKSRMKTAVHAPGMFRVIGAISNLEDFAQVFNCQPSSPMNPSKKCIIW